MRGGGIGKDKLDHRAASCARADRRRPADLRAECMNETRADAASARLLRVKADTIVFYGNLTRAVC